MVLGFRILGFRILSFRVSGFRAFGFESLGIRSANCGCQDYVDRPCCRFWELSRRPRRHGVQTSDGASYVRVINDVCMYVYIYIYIGVM